MELDHALELSPDMTAADPCPASVSSPREVLEEVFELLEEFGPVWYTEDLHNRVLEALRSN
jgi:hypothetical protein